MDGEEILFEDGIRQLIAKVDLKEKCVHFGVAGDYGYADLRVTKSSWLEIRRHMETLLEEVE